MKTDNWLVELEDVDYAYPSAHSDLPVLKGINLSIRCGEILRVTGRNGTGKTTLLKVIANRLDPTNGIRKERKNLRVMYLDQNASDFLGQTLTVREQTVVGLGRKVRAFESSRKESLREEIVTILSDYGVGLENKLDSFTSELSGGQRQIVALLSVLLGDAELVVLDEFTAAMDSVSAKISSDMIRHAVADGAVSVVFVNHAFHGDLQVSKEISLDR